MWHVCSNMDLHVTGCLRTIITQLRTDNDPILTKLDVHENSFVGRFVKQLARNGSSKGSLVYFIRFIVRFLLITNYTFGEIKEFCGDRTITRLLFSPTRS